MSDLLSQEDLEDVTGCKMPKKQCEVLAQNGIKYIKRIDGKPVVTWTAINNNLSSMLAANQTPEGDGFNLEAIS